jgi:hypothetical protein
VDHRWVVVAIRCLLGICRCTCKAQRIRFSKRRWRWEFGLRLVVILVIAVLLQSPLLRQFITETQRFVSRSLILGWTGVELSLLGFGLANSAAGTSGAIGAFPCPARSIRN